MSEETFIQNDFSSQIAEGIVEGLKAYDTYIEADNGQNTIAWSLTQIAEAMEHEIVVGVKPNLTESVIRVGDQLERIANMLEKIVGSTEKEERPWMSQPDFDPDDAEIIRGGMVPSE